jgi:bisphosphoglycerate-independent phosphoglycerate mutase (AlkP superfamily)
MKGKASVDAAATALRFVVHKVELLDSGLRATTREGRVREADWSGIGRVVARQLPPDPPWDAGLLVDLVAFFDGRWEPLRVFTTTLVNFAVLEGGSSTSRLENLRRLVRHVREKNPAVALDDDTLAFADGTRPPARFTALAQLAEYDAAYGLPVAFDHDRPKVTLAQIVSEAGLKQLHCAETEKAAHVTYFFNGGRGEPHAGEDRVIVPSPKVATYDQQPEMSAREVADAAEKAVASGRYAFIVVNFANGDMVGHTAVRGAVLKAVETLDREVGRVVEGAIAAGYSVILTSDHGNCDELVDPVTGTPQTQHTVYPVPCLIADGNPWRLRTGAGISGVAPTILHLLGLRKPPAMTADSLLLQPLRS